MVTLQKKVLLKRKISFKLFQFFFFFLSFSKCQTESTNFYLIYNMQRFFLPCA